MPFQHTSEAIAVKAAKDRREPWKAPLGKDRKIAEQEFQRSKIEKSSEFLRGLGLSPQAA